MKKHAIIIDYKAIRYMLTASKICNRINKENLNSDIEYIVLQNLDENDMYINDPNIFDEIARFYDQNFTYNNDFMHIPDIKQIKENYEKIFSIIIARIKKTGEIIAISTIKYDENTSERIDPYFPFSNKSYLSITGILTKLNSNYKGIGKKIEEIALTAYDEYAKKYNDTSMILVIDCRNKDSLNAIYKASTSIDSDLTPVIIGIYTVTDDNEKMIEAPTFVIKLKHGKDKSTQRTTIEFNHDNNTTLYDYLFNTIKEKYKIDTYTQGEDDGYHIKYYPITSSILPIIIPNDTAKGNDRIPNKKPNVLSNNSNGN